MSTIEKRKIGKVLNIILPMVLLIMGILQQSIFVAICALVALACQIMGLLVPSPASMEKRIADSRARGIYPPEGSGTDDDVKRVLTSGDELLAIRLYKEIHQVPLKQAHQAVKQMKSAR